MKAFPWVAMVLCMTMFSSCSSDKQPDMKDLRQWTFKSDSTDRGIGERWYDSSFERNGWEEITVPDRWSHCERVRNKGIGWFAAAFDDYEARGQTVLCFGRVDDDINIWVNGENVGSHTGYGEAFSVDVTGALKRGRNEVVLRVNGHGGPGGIASVRVVPFLRLKEQIESSNAQTDARRSEDWVKDGVIYAVYLRSFSKEGTLKALERRIPELKNTGFTIVWLMPIHPIGELNRKGSLGSPYSVQDYYAVNPEIGSLDDVRSLVQTIHAHGMKVVMDLVANHAAWDSRLMFENPEWFTTDDTGAIVSPNSEWYDVADLNYDRHELRKYMIGVMDYWVREIGIDGYRCDAAEMVPVAFWETARRELETLKPVIMLSESTFPEHHRSAFDITYAWSTYDVLDKILYGTTPASVVGEILENELQQFPRNSLRLRFNSNHDENAWDAAAAEKFGVEGTKATAVLMFTLPGVPLVYNGDEAGNRERLSLFERVEIDWSKNRDFGAFYQLLCKLRVENPALRRGIYRQLNSGEEKVLSFVREFEGERVLTVINLSSEKKSLELEVGGNSRWREYFSGREVNATTGTFRVVLNRLQANVYILQ